MPDGRKVAVTADGTPPRSKTQETIGKLAKLLVSTPAAEELRSSWFGGAKAGSVHLHDVSKTLDAGRSVAWTDSEGRQRGIPMWIIVRTCKAKWHHDGSWPLLGKEERLPSHVREHVKDDVLEQARSIHPSNLLLRPPGCTAFTVPSTPEEAHVLRQPEATMDDIADAYRRRGGVK